MTKRSQWDDQKVEDRLKQLPPIKDRQSKEELFQAIQLKMNDIDSERREQSNVKKKRPWIFPSLASVAAVFVLLLIIPSFINNQEFSSENNRAESQLEMASEDANLFVAEEGSTNNEFGIASDNGNMEMEESVSARYETLPVPYSVDVEMGDGKSFQVMLEGNSIPIPEETEDTLEGFLLHVLTSELIEGAVQLEGLQAIELNEVERVVTLDFSNDGQIETLTSTQDSIYKAAIKEVFAIYDFEKVQFTTNGEPGVMFGPTGYQEEWILPTENRGYYLYEAEDGNEYFVRGVSVGEWSMESEEAFSYSETLEQMKTVKDDAWYIPAIPEGVSFEDVTIEGSHALVTLSEDSELILDEYDQFIEAVSLAASDFSIDNISVTGGPIEEISQHRNTDRLPVKAFPDR